MSVSDPLITDIKECVRRLHNEEKIIDSNKNLENFCSLLETIFYKGLKQHQNLFYENKNNHVYTWMASLSIDDTELMTFNYKNSIDETKNCKSVKTFLGKFRLLVRHSLMKKCLGLPVEALLKSGKYSLLYESNSILGDEILCRILLSVLLHLNKITFDLDLSNAYFLDRSWLIPDLVRLELVPCKSLGISVSFSENRAFIVDIKANSVAAESGVMARGDVLANLNGVPINSTCKGRLNAVLSSSKGRPVNLVLIKAINKHSKEVFPPIKSDLKLLEINAVEMTNNEKKTTVTRPKTSKIGYKGAFLGKVELDKGGVREVEDTIRNFVRGGNVEAKTIVLIEIEEMNVKVVDFHTHQVVFKHPFMQISSCGCTPNLPNYIAYIKGDPESDSNFTCYIFRMDRVQDAGTVLQSIGTNYTI